MWPITHGAAQKNIKLYRVFQAMRRRCYVASSDMYCAYGARGIRICEEWLQDPLKFVDWALENGYADGLSIDRIDNNGNYAPTNCRFIDCKSQARNKQNTRLLTFRGETKCMAEWAEITGIPSPNIQVRIDRCGWNIERALTEPPKKRKQLYEYKGESMTINEWAKKVGVNASTIALRFKNGDDVTAPFTPHGERRKVKPC